MRRLLKDPLILFLIAGAAVFALAGFVEKTDDPRHIRVDSETLTQFVQHRSQLRDPELAGERLAGLSAQELRFVVDAYVREEALYREALRLGFGEGDYVVRRRLAQKVEFMADGAASALAPLTEEALRDYFTKHREDYRQPPNLTLTHVFFDASLRGETSARDAAEGMLDQLRAEQTGFNEAAGRGDAFLYHRNYAESTQADLTGHFGASMADALFEIEPSHWQGPLKSPYGWHLVLIANRDNGGLPTFSEMRPRVRTDAERARRQEFTSARIAEIVGTYTVTAELN